MVFLSMTLFGSWHLPSPKQYGFEQKSLEPSLAMQLWLFICITMVMAPISWDIAHHIHYIPIYGVGKRNASNLFKKTCAIKKHLKMLGTCQTGPEFRPFNTQKFQTLPMRQAWV